MGLKWGCVCLAGGGMSGGMFGVFIIGSLFSFCDSFESRR